ncbi:sn-glycerol-3-phosphate ABC transporter ATP-binding protein UgpC [Telmatospirillum sp.]|uniref:ABC transporter ATP-binding protein n=1 Tax=Telmatospirillum sp. TaxID=2079197 RepID=UPI00284753C3|nr:sn-glycerol-3-phosphate ABC transporter ATP-binding protein UgpC [Telmatospirillum sp.]MDR3438669.1 sn-glycerol-3-phosphate ABC transporter ATP-binding protein UgpC [Telmatospirillum sp.]
MSFVSLRNVYKSYGAVDVIHGVNLEIEAGEFIVFVGPSGCGKSTLMRMVAGLEEITKGEIHIGGRVVNDLPPRDRDIAMVFQDYALYPNKTVFQNMAFGLQLRKTPAEEMRRRVAEAAETLQITHLLERLPKALSGGQRQRVAMGRAIVREPKVFLFDEPLSNLDALLRNQVRAEIKKLHKRTKGTIIYVTHDQVEAMTLADRIVVLRAGHIIQVGTPDEIYHHPLHRFVAEFTGSPPMNLIDAKVEAVEDGVAVVAEGVAPVRLPPHLAIDAQPYIGREVMFGIRPENLHLADCNTAPRWPTLSLRVDLVEPMGAENLIHFTFGKGDLIGRFGTSVRPTEGTNLNVAFDPAHFHLFDKKSEQSIGTVLPTPQTHDAARTACADPAA